MMILSIFFSLICTALIQIAAVDGANDDASWPGLWFPKLPEHGKPIGASKENETWTGAWFPKRPDRSARIPPKAKDVDSWAGRWFPDSPTSTNRKSNPNAIDPVADPWKGAWFPSNPKASPNVEPKLTEIDARMQVNTECDDGKHDLAVDFDPANPSDYTVFRCVENRDNYKSNSSVRPILFTATIPTAYRPLHRCVSEPIPYGISEIPTFGDHRAVWPRYGEYTYVPVQRWLHNIEHGAIVMLYHPCTDPLRVQQLRALVAGCLYRHIITASVAPTPERPLVLVAWGHRLEMSTVDAALVSQFVRDRALHGLEHYSKDGEYAHLLVQPAAIVTDVEDTRLCPKN